MLKTVLFPKEKKQKHKKYFSVTKVLLLLLYLYFDDVASIQSSRNYF